MREGIEKTEYQYMRESERERGPVEEKRERSQR